MSIKKLLDHFRKDSQFRNSLYIMLATGVLSGLGFVFWIICSRLYSPHEIGLATSFISIASLLSTLSLFGLNSVIIRFLPTSDNRNGLISASILASTIGSIIICTIFLFWTYITRNPMIDLGRAYIVAPILILYAFFQATSIIFDSVFIAHLKAKYLLLKNTILGTAKLAFPFIFLSLGSIGIVYSITFGLILAWFSGLLWLFTILNIKFSFSNRWKPIIETGRFAGGNYIGNVIALLPASILPILITARLGAQEAAYFYMPLMITTLINVIPSATAQSLFAEASNNETELPKILRNATKHLFIFLAPAVMTAVIFGHLILEFFGENYSIAGTRVLQILAVSSFVGSLNYFGDTLLNIKKHSGMYIGMNAFNTIIILLLAYFSAPYGLVPIALSGLIGQIATLTVYLIMNRALLIEVFAQKKITARAPL